MFTTKTTRGFALKASKGFTLIEILVVIGLIAILAAIVLIAINPGRQFAQGRNTQRVSNVETILNSIGQNLADNKGLFGGACAAVAIPSSAVAVPTNLTAIPAAAKKITSVAAAGNVDMSCLTPTYVTTLPFDPSAAGAGWTDKTTYDTEYYVVRDDSATGAGRITVFAPVLEPAIGQVNYVALTR